MWQPTPYVFTIELGEPCDPRNALRALKTAAKRAGLPSSVGLHTLRHSAASVMLSAGVPLKVVSEDFGCASVGEKGGQEVKPIMKPSQSGIRISCLTRPFTSRAGET
jgi:hypothetical protein